MTNIRTEQLGRALLFAFVALRSSSAQRGGQPLAFFHHTEWSGDNGPPLAGMHQLMQSRDGYLWVSGADGLMRFDGVRFAVVDSTVAPALKNTGRRTGQFELRFVDAEGWLWIMRPDGGLVKYRDGDFLVAHPPEADGNRDATVDGAGRVWFSKLDSGVCVLRDGRIERAPMPTGVPDTGITGFVRDTGDGIWVGTLTQGLWHVTGSRAEQTPGPDDERLAVRPLLQSSDGAVWAVARGSAQLHRFAHGRWQTISVPGRVKTPVLTQAVVEDRTGAIWIAAVGVGVLRWRDGAVERFGKNDGLSDESAEDLIVDGTGSVWITGRNGALDQLRPTPFTTIDKQHGLSLESAYRFVEDEDGSLWGRGVATEPFVIHLQGGVVGGNSESLRATKLTLPANGIYDVLHGARGGGVWIAPHRGGLGVYRQGKFKLFTERDGLPAKRVALALEARDGAVWLATTPAGGFGRLKNGKYSAMPLPDDPDARVTGLVEDGEGHVWVSLGHASCVYELADDRIVRRVGPENGVQGPLTALAPGRGDTLWGIVQDSGIARIVNGRATFIATPMLRETLRGPRTIVASKSDLWIVGTAVARIAIESLNAVADGKTAGVVPRFYGPDDGLASARVNTMSPSAAFRAHDGRVWFSTPGGLAVIDPSQAFVDSGPPKLHIEEVSASGHVVHLSNGLEVPPHPSAVSIRYTGIDLLAPQRVRIQYRLDGVDESWVDATGPRVATYTQLRPAHYRFRVRAWNSDGVPSAQEATLSFRVLPAWYETSWALAAGLLLVGLTGAAGAIGIQRRRTLRSAEIMRSQFDATLAERSRIARELHDTLLQEFTGITLLLGAFRERLSRSPDADVDELSRILTLADASLFEARQSVWDMRSPSLDEKGLAESLQEIARTAAAGTALHVHCNVTGTPRPLSPQAATTVLHVAREAITNAANHSGARTVDVALAYHLESVSLYVVDDGVGMPESRPKEASRGGHFGILGMRERAASGGGTLAVMSVIGKGTRIELTLPNPWSVSPAE